jgi:alginate O-acetyltransferase complex protein AlgI
MITMLLGGLWHGASWTFVVWGGLHGAALALHKWMTERWPVAGPLRRAFGVPVTLGFVMVCWVFFRAPTFHTAGVMLSRLAFIDPAGCQWPYVQALVALAAAVLAHAWVAGGRTLAFDFARPVHVALLGSALIIDLLYTPSVHSPFIYFQF